MKKQYVLYVISILLFLFSGWIAGCGGDSSTTVVPTPAPSTGGPVLFVSGGTIDDCVSYLLLTTMDNIDLQGVIITNTDCIASYAMHTQWKIQSYINNPSVPITLSDSRGWNPFPWFYRQDCIHQSQLDILANYGDNTAWPPYPSGEALLRECLSRAIDTGRPLTVLNTCPITMLRNVLEENPQLERGIESIIMMGGAVDVPGNLDPETIPPEIANPKAEWNLFWDPYAFDWILKNTSCPMILFPLDVTDEVPVSQEFLSTLKTQGEHFRYSELVYQNYDLVGDQPYYRMWNSLTTSYVARPDLVEQAVPVALSIVTDGYEQGTLKRDSGGKTIYVVFNMADKQGFYSYVLNQFRRNYAK
jgi:purine nucleosidase